MELTDEMLIPTFMASGLTQEEFFKVHNMSLEKLRYHLYRKIHGRFNPKELAALIHELEKTC